MAVAYAALVSLLNTLDHIQIHPTLSTSFDSRLNQSLREKVDFIVDFVEKYSDAVGGEAEDLVKRIADVAHEAEDIIEVHAAQQIRNRKRPRIVDESTEICQGFFPDLQKITEAMDSIEEKVIKIKRETGIINRFPTISMLPTLSSVDFPATVKTTSTTMVGFDRHAEQLLDQLIAHKSERRIIPIVGMGGIGKTTLARNAYDNSLTVHHFDVRSWITVSQDFSACHILLQALSCLSSISDMDRKSDSKELGEKLSKILYNRRYLIVLDDVWSAVAWEMIRFFFPENNNGSRIVITTRESEVVDYFGSSAIPVDFLDDKSSWELFCNKAFAQQGFPLELEQVGKKIVNKCEGLPLGIILVGGLLAKSPRTLEYWEKFSSDTKLILALEESKPLSILDLSYKYLPVCLKSCLLYLGYFPEDYDIKKSNLIQLWVAEGFIKPNADQSLEEVAESYITNLIRRNLLLVSRLESYREVKTLRVHDLVRDMCIRIAEKENFFWVQRDINGKRQFISDERTARHYSVSRQYHTQRMPSLVQPQVIEGQRAMSVKSRLLRVLFRDAYGHGGQGLDPPTLTFQQVNLRFLHHYYPSPFQLHSSISLIWSLQTLIFSGHQPTLVPSVISVVEIGA